MNELDIDARKRKEKMTNRMENIIFTFLRDKNDLEGSGCGSVGRVVASNTRGPRFESSHQQNLLNICLLSTVLKRRK